MPWLCAHSDRFIVTHYGSPYRYDNVPTRYRHNELENPAALTPMFHQGIRSRYFLTGIYIVFVSFHRQIIFLANSDDNEGSTDHAGCSGSSPGNNAVRSQSEARLRCFGREYIIPTKMNQRMEEPTIHACKKAT